MLYCVLGISRLLGDTLHSNWKLALAGSGGQTSAGCAQTAASQVSVLKTAAAAAAAVCVRARRVLPVLVAAGSSTCDLLRDVSG